MADQIGAVFNKVLADIERVNKDIEKCEEKIYGYERRIETLQKVKDGLVIALDAIDEGHMARLREAANKEGSKLEKLKWMAMAGDGTVNVTKAVRALIAMGGSRSPLENLRSSVNTQLTNHKDWEKVGRGTFRYLGESNNGE